MAEETGAADTAALVDSPAAANTTGDATDDAASANTTGDATAKAADATKGSDRKVWALNAAIGVVIVILAVLIATTLAGRSNGATPNATDSQTPDASQADATEDEPSAEEVGTTTPSPEPESEPEPEPAAAPDISLVDPATDIYLGDPNAAVTLIEYSNFGCPYCKETMPFIEQAVRERADRMGYAYRSKMLDKDGRFVNQWQASAAAEAAARQGKYWEMSTAIFAGQDDWVELPAEQAEALFVGYASELGLDMAVFESDFADYEANGIRAHLEATTQMAAGAGIDSVPTLVLNGVALDYESWDSYEKLAALLDAALG
jgi:protein-disulfide isomerase